MAVTREIVTLHVGGWRCSPDIKQATFLMPESVSAEILPHSLPHHEPVPRVPAGSPELPGGFLFGQSQTQTRGALRQLLRLLPALLWILQVNLRSPLLLLQCSTDTTESATWTATAATALPARTTTAETPASGPAATTQTVG